MAEPEGSIYLTSRKDGKEFYARIWKPTSQPTAVVLAFHGLGEHINRYNHVYKVFAENGILVKGLDSRGHGRTVERNKGIKGHHDGLEYIFSDMMQLYETPVEPFGDLQGYPHFVMGHSKGGFLALRFTKDVAVRRVENFRGTISQAPMLRTPDPVPYVLKTAVWALGGTVIGRVTQPNGIDPNDICSHPPVVEDYIQDKYNHGLLSVRMARDLVLGGEALITAAPTFQTPICMYFARNDKLTSCVAGEEFMSKCGSKDKAFKVFEGDVKHEIHNEPSIMDGIISDYVDWILTRASGEASVTAKARL